jgi:hypothetical protein
VTVRKNINNKSGGCKWTQGFTFLVDPEERTNPTEEQTLVLTLWRMPTSDEPRSDNALRSTSSHAFRQFPFESRSISDKIPFHI